MAFIDWLAVLDDHGVEFVLVGGYAGWLHGSGMETADLDVVPRWTVDNLQRLCRALQDHHAFTTHVPRLEGPSITPETFIDRENLQFDTDLGHLDVLMGLPDQEGMPVDYDELSQRPSGTRRLRALSS